MYKWLIVLMFFFSCDNKQYSNLSIEDFKGTYKSSDDDILDTLEVFKDETFRHVQYGKSNDLLILNDKGSWFFSDPGYRFKNYRYDAKDTGISYITFEPYLGAFNKICIDIDMDGQHKYVKIKD